MCFAVTTTPVTLGGCRGDRDNDGHQRKLSGWDEWRCQILCFSVICRVRPPRVASRVTKGDVLALLGRCFSRD